MPMLAVLLLLAAGPDSSRQVAHARNAQAEFERARMFLARSGSASGTRCDDRIGRFCYRYSGEGGDLPREPEGIGKERAKLVAVLDTVARALPGDPWVAGQRVRYLIEAGQPDSAAAAARSCRAATWWCSALEGLAWHAAGRFDAAEQAFETELDSMPEAERCRWTDLSELLEGALRARYRALSCAERRGFDDRVWWLANPLWSLPGGGIPVGSRIGVYWEAYGLASGENVPTAVTVSPARRSLLTRVAAALGLAPKPGGVRLEWREVMHPPQGKMSRALVLDLAGLAAGRYRLDVTVSTPGRIPVTATRRLDLIER